MTPRITAAKIDALITKLDRVQADIDKLRIGDPRAADSERIKLLREAHFAITGAMVPLRLARPK
jgi:hypothetical protein